ncbi:1844_t:CDS:2 [Diversispora eburnea]|uniref:1844_t:CDS:1 n=1 Tax=Diversispora eburnea TaxID=1213867 RepID=A0A9N9AHI0_9GLOM|nr:1844_t:CDS:2 [Diversispora eburnea]
MEFSLACAAQIGWHSSEFESILGIALSDAGVSLLCKITSSGVSLEFFVPIDSINLKIV